MNTMNVLRIVVVISVLAFANSFVILENYNMGEVSNDVLAIQATHQGPTVRRFARHHLCRNFEGRKRLYNALKPKLCGFSLSFVETFVTDLCRQRNYVLDKWVGELFDLDGNGFISHYEK